MSKLVSLSKTTGIDVAKTLMPEMALVITCHLMNEVRHSGLKRENSIQCWRWRSLVIGIAGEENRKRKEETTEQALGKRHIRGIRVARM
jgi:hypothetical protein